MQGREIGDTGYFPGVDDVEAILSNVICKAMQCNASIRGIPPVIDAP